jgi:hypothetical protein
MQLERIRVWQWCIAGVVVGCAVAAVKLAVGPTEAVGITSVSPTVLEQQLIHRRDPSRVMVGNVSNVVLHPEEDGIPVPGERDGRAAYVTYYAYLDAHKRDAQGKPLFRVAPHRMLMALQQPGHPSVLGDISKLTLREYLEKLKAHVDKIDRGKNPMAIRFGYQYAWIETPAGAFTVYGLGGLIVVGGIWPAILRVLVGAGFGRVVSDGIDLSKYKPGAVATKAKPATDATGDLARIRALEESLERSLREGATPTVAAKVAAAPPAIKKLDGGPAEAPKDEVLNPAKPKGYGADQGDYYPTEVHGKSKS